MEEPAYDRLTLARHNLLRAVYRAVWRTMRPHGVTLVVRPEEQAALKISVRDTWDEERGRNVNFERFLRREVLAADESPIVWGLDEIDRLFPLHFSGKVFSRLRSAGVLTGEVDATAFRCALNRVVIQGRLA